MRQVARLLASTRQRCCMAFQHTVKVLGQRLYFLREMALQRLRASFPYIFECLLQAAQRTQPYIHLGKGSQHQQEQQSAQRKNQNIAKALDGILG